MPQDTGRWLLNFTSTNPNAPDGDGRPWGDLTAMAGRARATPTPGVPWDAGCAVTTHIGGYAAMRAMRQSLESAIAWAKGPSAPSPGQRGHVYLTDWRLNALRDISDSGYPWQPTQPDDPTAIGMLLQLMQAGIKVRALVWYPVVVAELKAAGFKPHIADHRWIANIISAENKRLMDTWSLTDPLGVVGLDLRVTKLKMPSGTHHQKSMVIRVGPVNVAFCGGVDLAFTRRDAPDTTHPFDAAHPAFMGGDYQSSQGIPWPTRTWPRQAGVRYDSVDTTDVPSTIKQDSDLPDNVYGQGWHMWHDQHLQLTGSIVSTIEDQFYERWIDNGNPENLNSWYGRRHWHTGQVIFSTDKAYDADSKILPPDLAPIVTDTPGASTVQLWRTIPLRSTRHSPPFERGEFTVMAGISHAAKAATQLIWIFDQYFWSRPLAKLLNAQVKQHPDLCVIVILPPHADTQFAKAHHARQLAFADLIDGLGPGTGLERVGMYDLWHPTRSQGIYCHAKVQMYDGSLLVCGSANLNRRSFTCDTEIACAVLDPAVVADHQQRLWRLLFPDPSTPWPGIDLNQPGSGKQFLSQFVAAARNVNSFLILDPWQSSSPQLPTKPAPTPRDQDPFPGTFTIFYNDFMDPSSIDTSVENDCRDATGALRDGRLDDIVRRLENVYGLNPDGSVSWPYRRS
jgi:phosphatidylserine/phosphatidylglycerophosphate/cardiolipin synthase-like enzyme